MNTAPTNLRASGFTLVELTIVLIIVALLTSGMVISFGTQQDINNATETQRQLNAYNDALLGYAATFQRLPCPATPTSGGQASYCTNAAGACGAEIFSPTPIPDHGRCTLPNIGLLPAATLGISPTDAQGFAVDAWNHRIRYAVTQANAGAVTFPFTAASTVATGIKAAWSVPPAPDLRICAQVACTSILTQNAVAVVLSNGKNGGAAPTGADELDNWTTSNDTDFVSHTQSPDFDDIVVWLSPSLLYNRLIASGRLP